MTERHLTIESLCEEDRLVWLMTYSASFAGGASAEDAAAEAWMAVRLRERAERCGAPPRPEREAPDPEQRGAGPRGGRIVKDMLETEWGIELRYFCDDCSEEIGDSEGVFAEDGGEWCDACAAEGDRS